MRLINALRPLPRPTGEHAKALYTCPRATRTVPQSLRDGRRFPGCKKIIEGWKKIIEYRKYIFEFWKNFFEYRKYIFEFWEYIFEFWKNFFECQKNIFEGRKKILESARTYSFRIGAKGMKIRAKVCWHLGAKAPEHCANP
jgi:hypothetical protein